jgi:Fe-S-cluster containining protein
MSSALYTTIRDHCLRCGVCCSQGGPTLHIEDLALFEHGVLQPSHVYTLRRGETVYHNVLDRIVQLDVEMIKIKERRGERACMFYAAEGRACAIYEHRPLQCRVLACWNTSALEKAFARPKITRADLLPPRISFLDILKAHDERCSPFQLAELAAPRVSAREDRPAAEEIMDMLRYDSAVRHFAGAQWGVHPQEMEFFFGRPLTRIIEAYGLNLNPGTQTMQQE